MTIRYQTHEQYLEGESQSFVYRDVNAQRLTGIVKSRSVLRRTNPPCLQKAVDLLPQKNKPIDIEENEMRTIYNMNGLIYSVMRLVVFLLVVVTGIFDVGCAIDVEPISTYNRSNYIDRIQSELTIHLVNGEDDIWPFPDRFNLTYCVDQSFDDDYSFVVTNLKEAADSWSKMVAVGFKKVDVSPCDNTNDAVVFNVEKRTTGYRAISFMPSYPREEREMGIRETAFTPQADGTDFQGILRHEFGHILGFAHEEIWSDDCSDDVDDVRLIDENYDPYSVMHDIWCNPEGYIDSLRQTPTDYASAIQVYGLAPALVMAII